MARARFIRWFHDIGLADVALVGEERLARRDGSGADPKGIRIPNGFAITAEGYWSVVRAGVDRGPPDHPERS